MSRIKRRGFTLIEVTLAIVIGIIMVAGATLIYNQAKTSAGNSRAQAKVVSAQAVVEQYMARADGVAPDIAALRAMWQRARADDFNKSPWGGGAFPLNDATDGNALTNGILFGNNLTPDNTELTAGILGSNPGGTAGVRVPGDNSWTGTLVYYKFPNANNYSIYDETVRGMVTMKGYGIATTNQRGERWFYVKGQSTGGVSNGSSAFGIGGQVGP